MKNILVVGGSNGIGLAVVAELAARGTGKIYIIDRVEPDISLSGGSVIFKKCNLLDGDLSVLDEITDIDALVITAGFGRVAAFEDLLDIEISNGFKVNSIAVIRIIKHFYNKIRSKNDFQCAVLCSIAGLVSSPMFSVYAATKAAVCRFIESVNIELEYEGYANRILAVSPGSVQGTRFSGGSNDLLQVGSLAREIIARMESRETLFVPQIEVFGEVIERYKKDGHEYGMHSIGYKLKNGRVSSVPQVKVGYLSGTFDLFHIGHLNLLRRAKACCDYLVVGVHRDASHKGKVAFIPFEERAEIVGNIKYVDRVIPSEPEDDDVYKKEIVKYDCLFVGSDYKGTERFNRYEAYFGDKDVQIIYLPYTEGTSSTQLRDCLMNSTK